MTGSRAVVRAAKDCRTLLRPDLGHTVQEKDIYQVVKRVRSLSVKESQYRDSERYQSLSSDSIWYMWTASSGDRAWSLGKA